MKHLPSMMKYQSYLLLTAAVDFILGRYNLAIEIITKFLLVFLFKIYYGSLFFFALVMLVLFALRNYNICMCKL